MNRKILFFLLISLCTTQVNACSRYWQNEVIVSNFILWGLATGASTAALATLTLLSIIPTVAAAKKSRHVLKGFATELFTLQKTAQYRPLTPQEKTRLKKTIDSFNETLGLITQKEWKTDVQNLLQQHETKLKHKNSLIRFFNNLSPSKTIKKLYTLEQVAQSRALTQDELQTKERLLKTLKKELCVTLKIDNSTDIDTITRIIVTNQLNQGYYRWFQTITWLLAGSTAISGSLLGIKGILWFILWGASGFYC